MLKKISYILFFSIHFLSGTLAQVESLNNQRSILITIQNDTKFSDSLTIDPNSIKIISENAKIKEFDFRINNNQVEIFRINPKSNPQIDTLMLHYRVFPFNLENKKTLLDSNKVSFTDQVIYFNEDDTRLNQRETGLISSNKLNYSGSFSRGLSFGNSQDLVLNSNLNLQLSGDLGNGLMIRAAISDEDIPIQPQGNTQVLQEFDKVFVEIQKDNFKMVAGDYELKGPNNYFSRYFKKLKGLSFEHNQKLNQSNSIISKASYAVSRGKFARINLNISEGNQGPYQLRNESNNRFIIVLSGTEKVFLDGRLLKRGLENDYTIDYNRGEISFTPNILITNNTRVIVEYEFTDQNYLRSLYAVNVQAKMNKWTFNIDVYNEQDSKTSTGNIELDSFDINRLSNAGDDLNQAFRSAVSPLLENTDGLITYQKVYEPSISDTILVYNPDSIQNGFTAIFTDVGSGNGSYNIDIEQALNGRIYKFVGANQGRYVAQVRLTPPERKHLTSVGLNYDLSGKTKVYTEFALSHLDINRFSQINNEDNTGTALRVKISDDRQLNSVSSLLLKSSIGIELKGKNFRSLNPYRAPEFIRDWNYFSQSSNTEQLAVAEFELQKERILSINYALKSFKADKDYKGLKNIFGLEYQKSNWFINGKIDYLNAENSVNKISFLRPNLSVRKNFGGGIFSVKIERDEEYNDTKDLLTDELKMANPDYKSYKLNLESNPNENLKFGLGMVDRKNYGIDGGLRLLSSDVKEYSVYGSQNTNKLSKLDWSLIFRDFEVIEPNIENQDSKKTFLSIIDHQLSLFNKGLLLNTHFESNAGQEPKLEEQFIEVRKGEGRYIWIDNAPADSIQQINEFVLTPFSDQGNYEKISLFNNEFIQINKTIVNQNLRIEPARWMGIQNKSILSKLSWVSRYRIDQKLAQDDSNGFDLKLINFNPQDSNIISYKGSYDHSLFINRGSPKYDGSIGIRQLSNKIVFINGEEDYLRKEQFMRWRISFKRSSDLILELSYGNENNGSEIFTQNNSEIKFYEINPIFSYRPSNNFRVNLEYNFSKKNNTIGIEKSTSNDLGLEVNWRKASNGFINSSLHIINIDYNGNENDQIELRMLNGLKRGANYLWNLNYTKRLSNSIDMSINYEGRKTGTSRTVHLFTTEIKANF